MAEAFESQALDQLTRGARRALAMVAEPRWVIRDDAAVDTGKLSGI